MAGLPTGAFGFVSREIGPEHDAIYSRAAAGRRGDARLFSSHADACRKLAGTVLSEERRERKNEALGCCGIRDDDGVAREERIPRNAYDTVEAHRLIQ